MVGMALNYSHPRFDVVEYIKKLRNVGVSQEVAEVQAQEMDHAIEIMIENTQITIDKKNLATKHNLEVVELNLKKEIEIIRKEIESSKNQMLICMGGFGVFFLGILAKGFHWI